MFKTIISWAEVRALLPDAPVAILQRLGVDSSGAPLTLDGQPGQKTQGGRFLNPVGPHVPGVSCAIRELLLGAQETGRGNVGPHVSRYYKRAEDDPRDHGAWCAAFASWCFGQDIPGAPYSWGARKLHKRMRPIAKPRPGCLATWERVSAGPYNGHSGIVAYVEAGGAIWTIEGNTGPRGAVRVYRWEPPYKRREDKLIGFSEVPL